VRCSITVGDVVCCYTQTLRTGRSSITLSIEVWVLRQGQGDRVKVTTLSSPSSRSTMTPATADRRRELERIAIAKL
jgi:acyl-CoA hydrolase